MREGKERGDTQAGISEEDETEAVQWLMSRPPAAENSSCITKTHIIFFFFLKKEKKGNKITPIISFHNAASDKMCTTDIGIC